jgi:PAS domain S-box-containing protein
MMTEAPTSSAQSASGRTSWISHVQDAAYGHHSTWVQVAMLTAAIGYGGAAAAELMTNPQPHTYTEWATSAVALLGLAVFRAGHRTVAVTGFIFLIWLEIHFSLVLDGLSAPVLLVLPPFLAGTGLLLGGRVCVWTAIGTTVTVIVTTVVSTSWRGEVLSSYDIYTLVVMAIVLQVMAVILSLGLHSLASIVDRARDNERKFSDLFVNAPDGIVALDGNGIVEALNPAAARLLDLDPKKATGKAFTNVLSPSLSQISRVTLDQIVTGATTTGNITFTRADDRNVAVEVTARCSRRDDGEIGLQIMLRDVSQRRAAEDRATQLGRVVEDALNELYLFDPVSWRIVSANRSARRNLGYTQAELRMLTVVDINPAMTWQKQSDLTAQIQREAVISCRGVHRRKNGSAYPVDVQLQSGSFDDNPVIVVSALDVTERMSAEEEQTRLQTQLRQAQKMEALGQLAGGVAHDFNNLLQVIGASAEILGMSGEGRTKHLSEQILEAQQRGARLTKQLLAFARCDITHARQLFLPEVIQELHPLLRQLVGESIDLRLIMRGQGAIIADPSQIEQIMLNLVANARDAIPDGGVIEIGVAEGHTSDDLGRPRDTVVLTVKDNGVGIPDECRPKIFEPFFTTKPRGKGTGLGLATVHGIVTQNGGTISIASAAEQGTCFTIEWPATTIVAEPRTAILPTRQQERREGRVLLAEDDEQARALVKMLLEHSGYSVTDAPDGESALAKAASSEEPFDLLLTDVIMPGLSGIEVAERMRQLDPNIAILFMSGYLADLSVGSNILDPDENVIFKPFGGDEIRARIAETLGRQSAAAVTTTRPKGGNSRNRRASDRR